jgi:hypothetical protein
MACVCVCVAYAKSKSVWIVLNQKIFIAFCRHQFPCVYVCVCARARVFSIVEKIIPEIAEGERNELEKAERIQVVYKWVRGRRRMG